MIFVTIGDCLDERPLRQHPHSATGGCDTIPLVKADLLGSVHKRAGGAAADVVRPLVVGMGSILKEQESATAGAHPATPLTKTSREGTSGDAENQAPDFAAGARGFLSGQKQF